MLRTPLRRAAQIALLLLLALATISPAAARSTPASAAGSPARQLSIPRGSIPSRPYTVMLDNHPDAYPQTGLNQAPLVFEALAEYGITRYMAVYFPGVSPDLQTIGPVRSARPYFVEWSKGLRGVYVHAGGSPEALTMAQTSVEILNMDALRRNASAYFRRARERAAPHNLYTSSADIGRWAAAQPAEAPDLRQIGFVYKADAPAAQRPASQRLSYYFLYKQSFVAWSYDKASNSYLYFRQRRPHVDGATGEQLRFKNVIVLEVPEKPIPGDPKKRIEQQVVGEGPARVFVDGKVITGTWRKGAGFAQLQVFGPDGAEIALNNGPTWVAAIPSLKNLTVE
jgi:hypothetical protein